MLRKYRSANLRFYYPLILEAGIILALLLLILAVNIRLPGQPNTVIRYAPSDEAAIILPPAISETQKIIRTPEVPKVPVSIPDDTPIAPPPLHFFELEKNTMIDPPSLAKEVKIEVDYERLKKIDVLPEMIGGETAFRQSIEYPKQARLAGIEGIVEVEFMVDEMGRVSDPVIVRGIGGGCDKAVLNAVLLQRYKPGWKDGKASTFKIKETVQFILLDT